MKIGLCLEMSLTEFPFPERLRIAARTGLRHVEMWWVDRSFQGSPEELARLSEDVGVRISDTLINAPDGSIGGHLTDPTRDPKVFLERVEKTVVFNRRAGIPATIVLAGNRVPGLSEGQMRTAVIESLKPAVEIAERENITLLLEALNDRYDHLGYWLTSSDAGAEICRAIGSSRLRLLFDCYHMQIMEGDLLRHIERNLDVIGHFHSAGVPGRHEIFLGEVDFHFVVNRIDQLGYQGIFGMEYLPTIDGETSARQSLDYLLTGVQPQAGSQTA